ncbi:unnamed protein product [Adineta steineri]|uniref:SH3 domain-containing protein n=1 Tax=Adineta steineri TaxID=433720 RepID=A0A819TGL1_9BILA|nr:unnamed protein product [Adineta steineri]CAF4081089.1 unnamed protein product [Adineta steineri]
MYLTIIRLFIILGIALAICEAGEVLCRQRTPIHTCASMGCPTDGSAITSKNYPCDCFKTENVLGKKKIWYKIKLSSGNHGYVADTHCSGDVPHC